jgi:hypothetical protein
MDERNRALGICQAGQIPYIEANLKTYNNNDSIRHSALETRSLICSRNGIYEV